MVDRVFKKINPASDSRSTSEVTEYLKKPRVENCSDFEPIKWWSKSPLNFLKLVAKDYLSISPSSVPSEQTFSAGGLFVTKDRTSLDPKSVKNLICLNSWNRKN